MNQPFSIVVLLVVAVFLGCGQNASQSPETDPDEQTPQRPDAVSLFGDPLYFPQPSEKLLARLRHREREFKADSNDPDKLIWYGRFVAYAGNYNGAIEIFNDGAKQFPKDARMLRHVGHRYISIRKFDQAIDALELAAKLIEGKENEIEPDGMPNSQNIPVSTLHGNIWYHLGLAYYLKHDFENALRAYQNCLATAGRPDNVVSATHWIYMIHRRLGREQEAEACLEPIDLEMDVIENTGYHQCCCFYKGLITQDVLEGTLKNGIQSEALDYAIGNWFLYNAEHVKAKQRMESLRANGAWNAFGFIAAESDLASQITNK